MNINTVGEAFEDYLASLTYAGNAVADNDATYVTVMNVTGAGYLVYASLVSSDPNGNAAIKITRDGATAIALNVGDTNGTMSWTISGLKFETSLKIEMKLGGAGAAMYSAFYGTE